MESRQNLDEDDRAVMMQLTPLYRQQLNEALEQGLQQCIEAERRDPIANLLKAQFGFLDESLAAIVDSMIQLSAADYT